MTRRMRVGLVGFLLFLVGATALASDHPLDPLTADEIRIAVQAARGDARLAGAAFPSIDVLEPPKAAVTGWQPGQTLARQARVVAMTADRVYELVVDLTGRRLVSVVERAGAEPSITLSEIETTQLVLSNAEFTAGLQKRGVTDFTKVFCAPFSAGYYAKPAHDGKRLVKVGCFDTRRTTTNLFGWPIERLYALVDLRRREVLNVTDQGVVPVTESEMNFTKRRRVRCAIPASQQPLRSLAARISRSRGTK